MMNSHIAHLLKVAERLSMDDLQRLLEIAIGMKRDAGDPTEPIAEEAGPSRDRRKTTVLAPK